MKMYILLAAMVLAVSCVQNKGGQNGQEAAGGGKFFEVKEVVQSDSYVYLKVTENSEERWVATGRQEVSAGEKFYYDEALQMTNFHSKDLDRTFDVIYFVNRISRTPMLQHPANHMHGMDNMMGSVPPGSTKQEKKSGIALEKSENELTIEQVFENKEQYSDRKVALRGVVVKVNKEIMGKNWVHIQDGTGSNGRFDLTITTMDSPAIGEEVTVEGLISLDRDFGSGYFYEVIMEDAKVSEGASGARL